MAQGGSYIDMSSATTVESLNSFPCQRHLFTDVEEDTIEEQESKRFRVFLRIKPLENEIEEKSAVKIINNTTVETRIVPHESVFRQNKVHHGEACRYSFTNVLGPSSTQKEVFEFCAKESIKKFFNGRNCLLFTYGTTDGGKTYTVQGTIDKPGLIPRTISLIFKTVRQGQLITGEWKPDKVEGVAFFSNNDKLVQQQLKTRLFHENLQDTDNACYNRIEDNSTFRTMETVLDAEVDCFSLDNSDEVYFSLWVSFTEVYNEAIFDLLKPASDGDRRPLKLLGCSQSGYYVKDLSYINVENEEEAYRMYMYGKKNLQVASTGLNKQSSRSHCIFSMTLIKYYVQDNPKSYELSRFTICDLAGTERQDKSKNIGERFVESRNINGSLLVLSRCFNAMKCKQVKGNKTVIPYKDSKLTRLFQQYLCGEETITMIVNISQASKLFNETQQVLKSSAIASSIILQPIKSAEIKKHRRSQKFSEAVLRHGRNVTRAEPPSLSSLTEEPPANSSVVLQNANQELIESLLKSNDDIQKKLHAAVEKNKTLKQKLDEAEERSLTMENEVRRDACNSFKKLYDETLKKYKTREAEADEKIKALDSKCYDLECMVRHYKDKLLQKPPPVVPFNCSVSVIDRLPTDEDNPAVESLTTQLKELKGQVKNLTVEREHLIEELSVVRTQYKSDVDKLQSKFQERIETLGEEIQGLKVESQEKNELIAEGIQEIKIHEENEKQLLDEITETKKLIELQQEKIREYEAKIEEMINQMADNELKKNKQSNMKRRQNNLSNRVASCQRSIKTMEDLVKRYQVEKEDQLFQLQSTPAIENEKFDELDFQNCQLNSEEVLTIEENNKYYKNKTLNTIPLLSPRIMLIACDKENTPPKTDPPRRLKPINRSRRTVLSNIKNTNPSTDVDSDDVFKPPQMKNNRAATDDRLKDNLQPNDVEAYTKSDTDVEKDGVRRSKRKTKRRVLYHNTYCSDTEISAPEDPKTPDVESPLSQLIKIAPLSSKKKPPRISKKK